MRRFSFVHRVAAVLTSVLMLQLSLLSTGALCRMHVSSTAHHGAPSHSMPANHGDCAAMSSCTAAAVALVAQPEAPRAQPAETSHWNLPANAPVGPVIAPELPPPRA
jgi:hypothetical protein